MPKPGTSEDNRLIAALGLKARVPDKKYDERCRCEKLRAWSRPAEGHGALSFALPSCGNWFFVEWLSRPFYTSRFTTGGNWSVARWHRNRRDSLATFTWAQTGTWRTGIFCRWLLRMPLHFVFCQRVSGELRPYYNAGRTSWCRDFRCLVSC